MIAQSTDPPSVSDNEPPERTPGNPAPSVDKTPFHLHDSLQHLPISALVDRCQDELIRYRQGEASQEYYALELFRRALLQHDDYAWEAIQQCFNHLLHQWMRVHPLRKVACSHESEENYVALAFTRFWLAASARQEITFQSLAAVLRYLRACLNGAVLDTVRHYSRAREVPLPEPGDYGEPFAEDEHDHEILWEVIRGMFSDERQARVAYLLLNCGLKPREIIQFLPHEFSDVQEIYRLRRNIFERLQRNVTLLTWRLDARV